MEYPKNLRDFDRIFATDGACLDFLEQVRWGSGFRCQSCSADKFWKLSPGLRRCQVCRFKNYVKAGSIFDSTRLPLKIWFYAIWWVTSQKTGVSALNLQKNLGLGSYRSSWLMLHKIRNAMIFEDRSLLQGDVEVDEAFLGGVQSGKRGRGAEGKELIVIAAEYSGKKRVGRIRIQRVPDASAGKLEPFITANIAKGATVHTDGWNGYNGVEKLGYKHMPIKSATVQPDELLPRINIVTSLLKRWLLGTLQGRLDAKHMSSYLEEFTFRFNRKSSKARGLLFQRVLENSINVKPAPYREIIARKA
ncbi:MAG: IS1595 family transposase [Pseudomonadota bacterium]